MDILFVINDINGKYLEYEHTGVLNSPSRRVVKIGLTSDQEKEIKLRAIGVNCGKPVMETIESVSICSE